MSASAFITGARAKGSKASRDFHPTGRETVLHLVDNEIFEGGIDEPACGDGAIARVFIERGHAVVASDIEYRGFGVGGVDAFGIARARAPNIVTNFAYGGQATERLWGHAMGLLARVPRRAGQTRKLALLQRFRFLETRPRDALFEHPAFVRMIVMARDRQPMMHRDGWDGAKMAKSTELYAWFVWDLDRPRTAGRHAEIVRV